LKTRKKSSAGPGKEGSDKQGQRTAARAIAKKLPKMGEGKNEGEKRSGALLREKEKKV